MPVKIMERAFAETPTPPILRRHAKIPRQAEEA